MKADSITMSEQERLESIIVAANALTSLGDDESLSKTSSKEDDSSLSEGSESVEKTSGSGEADGRNFFPQKVRTSDA